MWWRKKRKTGPMDGQEMGRLQILVNGNQRKLAGWLQVQSEKLSVPAKKMILAVGFLLFAALMIFQVINGLNSNTFPESGKIIKPDLPLPDTPHEYNRRQQAWKYLDSLGKTPEGRLKRDSLLNRHAKAADTIQR